MSLHFEYICVDKKNKMGTTLSGTQIKTTYVGILKATDNAAISGTLKTITDGAGNDTALSVSSSQVKVTNLLIDSPASSSGDEVLVRDSSTGLIGKRRFPGFRSVTTTVGSGTSTNGGSSAIAVTIADSSGNSGSASFQTGQNMTIRATGGTLNFKYDTRDVTKVTSTTGLTATSEAGTTVFLDWATLNGGTLTLPEASEGRFIRINVDVGHTTACNINAASGDYFYGGIIAVSTTDNKTAVQSVPRATAAASVASYNQITLDENDATLGGAEGSYLDLTCYDSAGWHVHGYLIGAATTPSSIAAINGQ